MDRYGQVYGWKDRPKDWSYDCVFNLQTLSVSVCSRSVADPLRSVNVFRDIFLLWKRQGCKGWNKDIQDGYTDNKDSHGRTMDEIQNSYGYQLQIWSAKPLQKIQAVWFFRSVPTDTGHPYRKSQGHYGCYGWPYGWKGWSVNHSTFSK